MSWQQATLDRYRKKFPKDSLRDVSYKTGIHYSRACRIFNGSEMRISELQAFERALEKKTNTIRYGMSLFEACLLSLPQKRLNEFFSLMERNLINYQIVHKSVLEQFDIPEIQEA